MAPFSALNIRAPDSTVITTDTTGLRGLPVYTSAILLSLGNLLVILLILPPIFWHARNRNIGATLLVGCVIMLNLQSLINALLWPTDNIAKWYNGSGLCDVEVKLQVAAQVASPAALGCVLRALARVMDTRRTQLVQTKAQRWRGYAIDLLWCFGFPMLQMLFHYIVKPGRYYLFGIIGCVPAVSNSWLTILLLLVPPVIWTLIDAYYASKYSPSPPPHLHSQANTHSQVLILLRLYRYRLDFASILATSNTTKSRFLRLYLLCILWILGMVPTQAYVLYRNLSITRTPYKWSTVHNPSAWNEIIMVPSHGVILYDRYIWLAEGVVVFVFFGLGKEAVSMYRSGLLALGFGRVFPSLQPDYCGKRGSIVAAASVYTAKAKMLFLRKSLQSGYSSEGSHTTSFANSEPVSPKTMTFPDVIAEDKQSQSSRVPSRIASFFQSKRAGPEPEFDLMPVTGGWKSDTTQPTKATALGTAGIMVQREVSLTSETVETLPQTVFRGV